MAAVVQARRRAKRSGEGVSECRGGLPLDEPIPAGDGWKAMGPDQPRACTGCGKKITLNCGEPLWFQCSEPRLSWHFRCKRPEVFRAIEQRAVR
jgi:hypothetical protein